MADQYPFVLVCEELNEAMGWRLGMVLSILLNRVALERVPRAATVRLETGVRDAARFGYSRATWWRCCRALGKTGFVTRERGAVVLHLDALEARFPGLMTGLDAEIARWEQGA